jgi:hypothetical protein
MEVKLSQPLDKMTYRPITFFWKNVQAPMVGAWVYSDRPEDNIFLEIEGRKSARHQGSGWEWLEVSAE